MVETALDKYLTHQSIMSGPTRQVCLANSPRTPWSQAACEQRLVRLVNECRKTGEKQPILNFFRDLSLHLEEGLWTATGYNGPHRWLEIAYNEECYNRVCEIWEKEYQPWWESVNEQKQPNLQDDLEGLASLL